MLRDGTVNILARGCENGTHRPSTYTQIVAIEVGLRYEDVNWKNTDDPGFDVAGLGCFLRFAEEFASPGESLAGS